MRVPLASLLAILTAVAIFPPAGDGWQARDLDCSDFSSQQAAQHYFDSRGGSPSNNVDNLDADGDGRACETMPCPCAGGGDQSDGTRIPGGRRIAARILRVVDGDTLEAQVRRTAAVIDVRLIGIDTPETKRPGTEIECGGPRASSFMRRIADGRKVTLITDSSQDRFDRYGRLLAYAVRLDGLDLNRAAISGGWAEVYVYAENPFRRVTAYRRAEDRAKSEGRGIWSLCGESSRAGEG